MSASVIKWLSLWLGEWGNEWVSNCVSLTVCELVMEASILYENIGTMLVFESGSIFNCLWSH